MTQQAGNRAGAGNVLARADDHLLTRGPGPGRREGARFRAGPGPVPVAIGPRPVAPVRPAKARRHHPARALRHNKPPARRLWF